ncbi:MAG: HupE/UreJ family protein [Pseudomonadota bacterium]
MRHRLFAFVVALSLWPTLLFAHARSESYSNWNVAEDRTTAIVTVTAAEIAPLIEPSNPKTPEQLFSEHLLQTTAVFVGAERCPPSDAQTLQAARGFVRIEVAFVCRDGPPSRIAYQALFDKLPQHVHFARIFSAGSLIGETVITARNTTWTAEDGGQTRHSFGDFFALGVEHILGGVDHVAFLIGLLLLAGTLTMGVAAVTGFTIGHSISLAAAVLGIVSANGRLIEAFIGFTVALVAIDYFQRRTASGWLLSAAALAAAIGIAILGFGLARFPPAALLAYGGFGLFALCYLRTTSRQRVNESDSWRFLLAATLCFGLIHGFGFAGFLMDTGIRGSSLIVPLLGFNVGVEVGQLALLVAFVIIGKAVGDRWRRRLAPGLAAALCAVGVFWFVGRSLSA